MGGTFEQISTEELTVEIQSQKWTSGLTTQYSRQRIDILANAYKLAFIDTDIDNLQDPTRDMSRKKEYRNGHESLCSLSLLHSGFHVGVGILLRVFRTLLYKLEQNAYQFSGQRSA